MNTILMMW